MFSFILKRYRLNRNALIAPGLIFVAFALRFLLIVQGWPESNSDEGTFGLEAMHILFRGEHPIFMYGQSYMGTLEAFMGALQFQLFGVSLFSLRLGMLVFFVLFLISLYLLTRLLYTRKVAIFSLALLALGARDMLIPEIRAVGGAAETLLFGALLFLLASWLALDKRSGRRYLRPFAFAGWGLVAGLGLWSHTLIAPFICTSGLLLLIFCWRDLLGWSGVTLLGGLLLGLAPLIRYNMTAPPGQDSLTVFLKLHQAESLADPLKSTPFTFVRFWKEITGSTLYSLPLALGMSPVCKLQDFPLFGPGTPDTLSCSLLYGSWGIGYLLLFLAALGLAVRPIWQYIRKQFQEKATLQGKDRQALITHCARFLLLTGAALTLIPYATSPVAELKPWSTRYLVGLLIAIPAVLWPLCYQGRERRQWTFWLQTASAGVLLAGLCVGMLLTFRSIPDDQALDNQQAALATNLLSHHITRIYGDYWTCDEIIFQSQEKIICSAVDLNPLTGLHGGLNRYLPYRRIVISDPQAAYVFQEHSAFAEYFLQKIAHIPHRYRILQFAGYMVFQPLLIAKK